MATIRPFQGIRPQIEYVEQIAALPYDVYSSEEAREIVEKNPLSFLRIDRAETNFDVGRCHYLAALQFINDNPKKSATKLLRELTPYLQKAQTFLEKAYEINRSSVDARSILRDIYYRLSDGEKLDILEHGS